MKEDYKRIEEMIGRCEDAEELKNIIHTNHVSTQHRGCIKMRQRLLVIRGQNMDYKVVVAKFVFIRQHNCVDVFFAIKSHCYSCQKRI